MNRTENYQYGIISTFFAYALSIIAFRLLFFGLDYPPTSASNFTPTFTDMVLQCLYLGIFFFIILFSEYINRWKPMYIHTLFVFTWLLFVANSLVSLSFLASMGGKGSYLYISFWFIIGIFGLAWIVMDKKKMKLRDKV